MDYVATIWADGDLITAEKLNHLETGVEDLNSIDLGDTTLDFVAIFEAGLV
jgi:hypothetical protein